MERRIRVFTLQRANRKKEGKAFVIPASEYDSNLYECLARGYLTKVGRPI